MENYKRLHKRSKAISKKLKTLDNGNSKAQKIEREISRMNCHINEIITLAMSDFIKRSF